MTADNLIDGRYRLHEQVGSGGMGVVWRATDELLGRQVAIKRIRLDNLDPDPPEITRQRMLREARIAAKLHHPHIVSIFDVLTVNDEPWLVLEYLPSESLTDALKRGLLTPHHAAAIGAQIADALAAAHSRGIVHRDVKPGNVLLSRTGEVKLTDFGISRATGDVTLTSTGLLTGTPGYLSPELCRGEPGGTASDVYSLGATLYAAVEGAPPFGDGHDNLLSLIRRIASEQAPPPTRAGPLTPVLRHLLDRNPAVRPNALAARELLRQVADPTTTTTTTRVNGPPPGPIPERTAPPANPPRPRRRRLLVTGSIACVLAVTAALLIGLSRGGGSDTASPQIPTPTTQAAPPSTTASPRTADPIPGADPRTADPCSLMDPAPLAAFGESDLIPDFGEFSACQIEVYPASGGTVIVTADFLSRLDPNSELPGAVEIRGNLGVGREPEINGQCARTILLPDRTQLFVSAELRDAVADTCAIAETATQTALTKLTTPGIGQRPIPDTPGSLTLLDVCALLDPSALTAAGIAAPTPTPGFANWYCSWGDTPRVEAYLRRQDEIDADDGSSTTVAGRTLLVLPGDYDGRPDVCQAQVLHRRFLASTGAQRVEKLQIRYTGTGPPEELCRIATELATNAIPKLPPIR